MFFNDTATTEIYTLSLHDALPILSGPVEIFLAQTAVALTYFVVNDATHVGQYVAQMACVLIDNALIGVLHGVIVLAALGRPLFQVLHNEFQVADGVVAGPDVIIAQIFGLVAHIHRAKRS